MSSMIVKSYESCKGDERRINNGLIINDIFTGTMVLHNRNKQIYKHNVKVSIIYSIKMILCTNYILKTADNI